MNDLLNHIPRRPSQLSKLVEEEENRWMKPNTPVNRQCPMNNQSLW
jgi:hypothetical protein